MKLKQLKMKIILMQITSFIVSIAPLLITVAFRWDKYVQVPSDAVKLTTAGAILVILLFLKTINRLRMPQKRVVLYLFLLIMCYLLTTILVDITFLVAMATLGEILDMLICQHFIKKWKEAYVVERNASATTEQVKKEVRSLFDEFIGGGRS